MLGKDLVALNVEYMQRLSGENEEQNPKKMYF